MEINSLGISLSGVTVIGGGTPTVSNGILWNATDYLLWNATDILLYS